MTNIGQSNDRANAMSIQSDNKIILAGYCIVSDNVDIALARYNPNGSLDNSFGTNGIVSTKVGQDSDIASSLILQKDNKILVNGYYLDKSNYNFALLRYDPDGNLDESFGVDGIVKTQIDSLQDDYAHSITLQNEKIIVAGYSPYAFGSPFIIVRYYGDNTTKIEEKNISQVNDSFTLEQNYPNPFNPSTTITYSIPVGGFVKLKVYDVLGRELLTLVEEHKNAGSFKVEFRPVDLSSGVYFYTLSTEKFIQTKKLMLIR